MAEAKIYISKELIKAGTGAKDSDVELLYPYLKAYMNQYEINTPARALSFLAQIGVESARLARGHEFADGSAYEGRCQSLGNCQPGDGKKFKGRGLIQLTGRANYEAFKKDTGIDVIKNPDKLAAKWTKDASADQLKNSVLASVWYWNKRKLNDWADKINPHALLSAENQEAFNQIGYRINGKNPPNGAAERNALMLDGLKYYIQNKPKLEAQKTASNVAKYGAIALGIAGAAILGYYLYKRYKK